MRSPRSCTLRLILYGKLTHLTRRTVDESGAESTEDMFFFYEERSDIIGIVDAAGNPVVEYKYDAWGKLLSTTCLMAYILGKYKLLRYRGYIYEEETELYYLRSCYYNPVFRRLMRMISNTLVWMGNCSAIKIGRAHV